MSVRAVGVKCNWANLIVNEILYSEGRLLRCPEYGESTRKWFDYRYDCTWPLKKNRQLCSGQLLPSRHI